MRIDGRYVTDTEYCNSQEQIRTRQGLIIGYVAYFGDGCWNATSADGRHRAHALNSRATAVAAVREWHGTGATVATRQASRLAPRQAQPATAQGDELGALVTFIGAIVRGLK